MLMDPLTLENGSITANTDLEFKNLLTVHPTKENFMKEKSTARANLNGPIIHTTKVPSSTIKCGGKGST